MTLVRLYRCGQRSVGSGTQIKEVHINIQHRVLHLNFELCVAEKLKCFGGRTVKGKYKYIYICILVPVGTHGFCIENDR